MIKSSLMESSSQIPRKVTGLRHKTMRSLMEYRPVKVVRILLLLIILLGSLPACEKNLFKPKENNLTVENTHEKMKEWYLWIAEVPEVIPSDYQTPRELLNAMLYDEYDRWSYIADTDEFQDLMENSQYVGHGFGYQWDSDNHLKVAFVFENSQPDLAGVKRGWEILDINGTAVNPDSSVSNMFGADKEGIQNTISFKSPGGTTLRQTFTKEVININGILYSEVIEQNGTRISYFVLQNFYSETKDEITSFFSGLQDQPVDEMIIDLRYNTGGQINISNYLANLTIGDLAHKSTFVKFVHNENKTDLNSSKRIYPEEYTIDLDRIFFITSGMTASASEILINGLKPYIDVYLIGDDTYGKPVGMYTWEYNDLTLVPVCFKLFNRNSEGDYYDGIPVNAYVKDNLDEPLGSRQEDCLKETLYFIRNGSFSSGARKSSLIRKRRTDLTGFEFEIGAK